jgi:hypothetical protein
VLVQQRFANDRASYRSMTTFARGHCDRVWPLRVPAGWVRGLAQRLVAEGEPVLDVPARCRPGSTRWVVAAAARPMTRTRSRCRCRLRARELQLVRPHDTTKILRMLSTHRQEVVGQRTATVNWLHDVLCQLIHGGAKRCLSVTTARGLLPAVRPRDAVGKARERLDARLT